MKTGHCLILSLVWLFSLNAFTSFAQEERFGSFACQNDSSFVSEIIHAEKIGESCYRYTIKVTTTDKCRYDLSHFNVGIPCGKITQLSNSAKWKQEIGYDPVTKLKGFKIDDINGFKRRDSFTVTFKLCSTNEECTSLLDDWSPVVAYKAGRCVYYDTLTNPLNEQPDTLVAHLEKTDLTCFESGNGAMTAVIDDGTAPFSFQWSTGGTSQTISELPAGTYQVIITDASGHSVTLNETLQQPTPPEISAEITHPSCSGADSGAIVLVVDEDRTDLSYSWNTGATTKDLESLSEGSYTVTITDSTGCQYIHSFVLEPATEFSITATATRPSCNQTDGMLDITVSGGTEPYTYLWSTSAQTEDLTDIGAGVYTVTVTDASGCTKQMGYVLQENNTLRLTASVTPTACIDDGSGAINLTVTGGTLPYSYTWSNGYTGEDPSNLTAGAYEVTVTDASGCDATLRINVPKKTLGFSLQVNHPSCPGEQDGSVTVTVTSGEAPFQYQWSNGGTTNSIEGLSSGTYTLIITDNSGCSRTTAFVLTDPQPLSVSALVSNTQCGDNGYYAIDLTVTGGTMPYTYEWSSGQTIEDPDSLQAGTYTVLITDVKGCTRSESVVIEAQPNNTTCLIQPIAETPVCSSTGNLLSAVFSETTQYAWSVESSDGSWVITSGTDSSAVFYTAGNAGTHATFTLTVTSGNCIRSCSITLTSCKDDPQGGGNNGGGECVPDYDIQFVATDTDGTCHTYEVTVSTTGNNRYDLSHMVIAIPCGYVDDKWNSKGWPMSVGKDPKTGLTGLKVDDISSFGKKPSSFRVTFTICGSESCIDKLNDWSPVVSFKSGQCIAYDTLTVESDDDTPVDVCTYPNPFRDRIVFEWTASHDDHTVIDIYDLYGHPVKRIFDQRVFKHKKYRVELASAELNQRMYIYCIRDSRKTTTGKLFRGN